MAVDSTTGLLETVKSFLTPDMMQQMTRHVGEPVERVQAGVQTAVPALLAGVVQKGSSESGARDLLTLIQRGGFDQIFQPGALLERVSKSAPQEGQGMLSNLFGNRLDGIADLISRKSGLTSTSSHSLLGFLAPIVLGALGMRSRGMGAGALMGMLSQQKDAIFSALPQGFAQVSNVRDLVTERTNRTTDGGRAERATNEGRNRWIWPAVIAAAVIAGLFWMNRDRQHDQSMVPSQQTTGTMGASVKELAQLNSDQIMEVQRALDQRGYQVPIDGLAGGATHDALRDFQMKKGIDGNGALNPETVRQLGLPENILQAH